MARLPVMNGAQSVAMSKRAVGCNGNTFVRLCLDVALIPALL
jgi:hypothetical protein